MYLEKVYDRVSRDILKWTLMKEKITKGVWEFNKRRHIHV